jgi:hypothetical protein
VLTALAYEHKPLGNIVDVYIVLLGIRMTSEDNMPRLGLIYQACHKISSGGIHAGTYNIGQSYDPHTSSPAGVTQRFAGEFAEVVKI